MPPGLEWRPLKFELHSLREGILTLAALARFRNSSWAPRAGREFLETIRRALKPDFTWDIDQFEYAKLFVGGDNESPGHLPSNKGRFPLIVQHGRCIEALVCFYEAPGLLRTGAGRGPVPLPSRLYHQPRRHRHAMGGRRPYLPREQVRTGCEIVLRYGLPTRRTSETLPMGDTYEFAWKGDEITGVHPNDKPMPFYPTLAND